MKAMKKSQQLGTGLIGLPIFERASLMPLATVRELAFRAQNLQLAYYIVIMSADNNVRYIQADRVAPMNGWLTVNQEEDFGELDDYIRDQQLLRQPCSLFAYKVKDTSKKTLGVLQDFSLSMPDMRLTRLYIKRPFFQRLQGEQIILPRSHITDVKPEQKLIIVQPLDKTIKQAAAKAVPA